MKCPYEVPQYSERLGIVRKCDMCASRLAVGEAPACVQACPNGAIRIELMDRKELSGKFRELSNPSAPSASFLPDSPDPSITVPTTKFLSSRPWPDTVVAADGHIPRVEPAHGPLVAMLVWTQSSVGIFVGSLIAGLAGIQRQELAMHAAGLGFLMAGLGASVFHLGQPLKAWRAFLGWRKSWLSREIIAFSLLFGSAAALVAFPERVELKWLTGIVGLGAVFTSAMVYIDTKRPVWSRQRTFIRFFGSTILLGASFSGAALAWFVSEPASKASMACRLALGLALAVQTILVVGNFLEDRSAARNLRNPLHLNALAIHELLSWTMRARTVLFLGSTFCYSMVISGITPHAREWAMMAAAATLCSELVGRYTFFAAGGAKRMPGGIGG